MKSWTKVRGEMPPEGQERMDTHLQSFIARLLSVTSDLDRSQHLVYDQVEGVSAFEGIACYAAGEELLSCEGVK